MLPPVQQAFPALSTCENSKQYLPQRSYNFELHSPLSCRLSIRLASLSSQSIGGIRDRRFQFLLYRQTSGQECVLQRATFATVADMRRRPSLSIRWKHHCRLLVPQFRYLTRPRICISKWNLKSDEFIVNCSNGGIPLAFA